MPFGIRSLAATGLAAASLAAVLGLAPQATHAADYPSRPITLVVPSTPGGGTDTQARILASKMGELLGQPVIIDNKGGASGNIGAQFVAKAPADGYTLLAMISSHTINPYVLKSVPYDIDRDFTLITRTVTAPGVLVGHPSVPARTLPELIAYAKANPGKVTFSSAGSGSLSHLAMELFSQAAGIKLQHVPYRATAQALTDVIADHVNLMMSDLGAAQGYIRNGGLRSFGVSSAARSPEAPDLPTLAESGLPGFEAVQWFGLAAPAGTPPDIVQKLFAAASQALNDPATKEKYNAAAMTPAPSASPEDYAKFVRAEGQRWRKVVQDARIVAE
ncbi:MAG: tripartite tricarboxylate transporter substrate binding protein [Pseudomonadota bacterium]